MTTTSGSDRIKQRTVTEPTVVCTHHKDWVQRLIFDYQMSVRPQPIVLTEQQKARE